MKKIKSFIDKIKKFKYWTAVGCSLAAAFVVIIVLIFITISMSDDSNENKTLEAENLTSVITTTEIQTTTEEDTPETTVEIITETTTVETTTPEETTQVQVETTTTQNIVLDGDYSYIQPIQPTDGVATLVFVGDVNIGDKIENYYNQNGLDGFLSTNLQNTFLNSDVFALNHEYVSSDAGDEHKVDYELWYYKNPTRRQVILNAMGVDVVTLANNHTLDYGEEGLVDTMNALNQVGVSYVGVGHNLNEAKSAYIKEINGKKIAILASNRVVPRVDWYANDTKPGQMTTYEGTDRYQMILSEISRLKNEEGCDLVVVMVHWGENEVQDIQQYQINVGHGYIDAGADVVIGSHTHTLQGAEIYNGKYIFYGVSNFLFENYRVDSSAIHISMAADNSLLIKLIPCVSQNYIVTDVSGNEAKRIFLEIESLSPNISIDDNGIVKLRN